MGFVTALSLLVRGITAVLWGYLGDRYSRKWLLLTGTIIWVLATGLTGNSKTFPEFLSFQVIASIGFGCIEPLGFSVVSDFISPQNRGTVMSFWGLSQSWGMGIGLLLGGYLGAINWRLPYN